VNFLITLIFTSSFVLGQQSETNQIVTVQTESVFLLFTLEGLTYHTIDPTTGKPSEDALVMNFDILKEVTPDGELVQLAPEEPELFNVTLCDSLEPSLDSNLIYESAYRVDIANIYGTAFTFWVFTKEQTVYDVYTDRTFQVSEGSMKYSVFLPSWPFQNEENFLQIATNVTTLIPNTLSKWSIIPSENRDITAIGCNSETLKVSFELINTATTIGLYDYQIAPLRTQIDIFICPLDETSQTRRIGELTRSGDYCNINIVETLVPI